MADPQWITETEAAARIGVSLRTLQRYRAAESGPAYSAIGGRLRYMPEDVEQWLTDQRRSSPTGGAASPGAARSAPTAAGKNQPSASPA